MVRPSPPPPFCDFLYKLGGNIKKGGGEEAQLNKTKTVHSLFKPVLFQNTFLFKMSTRKDSLAHRIVLRAVKIFSNILGHQGIA